MGKMKNCLKISLCLLILLFSFSLVPVNSKAATDHLIINEVYYDVAGDKGGDPKNEWIEIYNPTSEAVNLKNWTISDSTNTERIIQLDSIIEPRGFAVITPDIYTWSYWSLPEETVRIELKSYIGSGLNNNGGDKVILKKYLDGQVDEISYGGKGDYDLPDVIKGHSLERAPVGGNDFVDQVLPTPGVGLPSKTDLFFSEADENSIVLNWTENPDDNFKNYILFQSLNENFIGAEEKIINDRKETKILVALKLGTNYFKIRVENKEGGFWDSNIVVKGIYSSALVINELFPAPHEPFLSPETNDEYIELYNSSSEDIDLEDWILEDLGGKRYIISKNTGKETIIAGFSYMLFYKSQTKISLNNDETESIHLFWPDGGLCSVSTEYPKAEYNMSWSRNFDGRWIFSTSATPGAENVITIEGKKDNPTPDANLQVMNVNNVKKQPKNSWVKVSGTVTAIPGLFGKKVAYIQDESGGIKIYFDQALWPDLKIGDKVIILGKISTSSGEYQIKVYHSSDIVITDHSFQSKPAEHKINEINELVGQLIKISGKVTKISGSSVWFDDGTGVLRMYFYAATGIKGLNLEKGDWLEVVGILSKTSAGLRLLPRSKEDIKIIKQSKGKVKAAEDNNPVAQILGVEKAYAASDYRTDSQPAEIKKKLSYLWGGIVLVVGLLSLATLLFFARIREKYAKDNQFL